MIEPGPAHRYPVDHTERLRRSFHVLTGRELIDPALAPEAAAAALFHAPFAVLSPGADPDPLLTYGNRQALELRTDLGGTDPNALAPHGGGARPGRAGQAAGGSRGAGVHQ